MKILKSTLLSLAVLFIIFISVGVILHKYKIVKNTTAVLAEEEEEEDENEEEDDEDDDDDLISTDPEDNQARSTETKTIYTKLSDTVTRATTTITRHDSDGDGKYDDEDAHPTINDDFIAMDDNLNGIDDRYEQ